MPDHPLAGIAIGSAAAVVLCAAVLALGCGWHWLRDRRRRRRSRRLRLVALVLLAVPFSALAHDAARVTRVIDCDTLEVSLERLPDEGTGRVIRVRVRGISAPELRQAERPLGLLCTVHLRERLPAGTPVWLVPPYEPSVGGRWGVGVQLSPVTGAHDLAAELVAEGWARWWTDWKRTPRPPFDPASPYPLEP